MTTQYPEIWQALAAPFDPKEVKQLPKGGRKLDYITARSAMNRLDAVLGPENWEDRYTETRSGLMCQITITLPDGRQVTKCDGGAAAEMKDADDSEKSAFSHAFKRAAAKFGIGRYLYKDGVVDYAAPTQGTPQQANGKKRTNFNTMLRKALDRWNQADPVESDEAWTAREHRLVNHLCTWALDQGLINHADVAKDDKPDVRDSGKVWRHVAALYGREHDRTKQEIINYLYEKINPQAEAKA